jgi:hypothetical protein
MNVLGGRYLKSHVGQRAQSRMLAFIQGEIERRILYVELGITRTDLQRFDSKEPLIELDAGAHGCNVQGNVCFQYGRNDIFVYAHA